MPAACQHNRMRSPAEAGLPHSHYSAAGGHRQQGRRHAAGAASLQPALLVPQVVVLRSPSAVTRPSPQVYMKALILGSTTWVHLMKKKRRDVTARMIACSCRGQQAGGCDERTRSREWRMSATRTVNEHEPEHGIDKLAQQFGRDPGERQPTCVRRTSATRNMNLRMPSRRAMMEESEMKMERERCLGCEMRLHRGTREEGVSRGGGGAWAESRWGHASHQGRLPRRQQPKPVCSLRFCASRGHQIESTIVLTQTQCR